VTILKPSEIRRLADMHAVYRMFDEAGRLLYIGRSGRAGGRFDQHSERRWFPLVSVITLEWHATYAAAVVAERRAIAAECPRYNVVGTPAAKKQGTSAKPKVPVPVTAAILPDILAVFEDARGLQWSVIAARLARKFPDRWAGITREAIAGHCRALGVPTVNVRLKEKVTGGCHRTAIEQAMARQLLRGAI
jgi:hypothetical protein